MHKYEVILYWSHADQAFVDEVPELPGCAAHGNTSEEALKNVQDAMTHGWTWQSPRGILFPSPGEGG